MEGLLANTDKLKGKMKEKVEANKELGLLSKELAKILLDVPVRFEADAYALSEPDFTAVEVVFDELEFRRMKDNLKKTFGLEIETTTEKTTTSTKATPTTGGQMDLFAAGGGSAITHENNSKRNLSTTPHHYQYINTTLGVSLLIEKLMHQSRSVSIPKQQA